MFVGFLMDVGTCSWDSWGGCKVVDFVPQDYLSALKFPYAYRTLYHFYNSNALIFFRHSLCRVKHSLDCILALLKFSNIMAE